MKKLLIILISTIAFLPLMALADTTFTATSSIGYSTAYDALINRDTGVCDTWTNFRAATTSTIADTTTASGYLAYMNSATCATSSMRAYKKSIFKFDTSPLPDNAVITGATFSVWTNTKQDSNSQRIVITAATTASTTGATIADYAVGNWGTTCFASSTIAEMTSDNTYWDFVFNSAGRAAINLTGITTLGSRLSWDFDNVAPTVGNTEDGMKAYYADDNYPPDTPKLVITYTLPSTSARKLRGVGITR